MSRVLNISVSKYEVFEEVGRITEYVGKKSATEGAYETIATIKSNDTMLERFWSEGCNNISETLKHFLAKKPENDESYTAECRMTNNWNFTLGESINEECKNYLVQYIVAKWMRMVKADEEQKYFADSVSILDSVESMLLSRIRPMRFPLHCEFE